MHDRLRRPRAPPDAAALERVADERREHSTRAERALEAILNGLGEGVLEGRFRREWVCGARWIVDFYFPEVRLAIESTAAITARRHSGAGISSGTVRSTQRA